MLLGAKEAAPHVGNLAPLSAVGRSDVPHAPHRREKVQERHRRCKRPSAWHSTPNAPHPRQRVQGPRLREYFHTAPPGALRTGPLSNDENIEGPSAELGLDPEAAKKWDALAKMSKHLTSALKEMRKTDLPMRMYVQLDALLLETLAECTELVPSPPTPELHEKSLKNLDAQRDKLRDIIDRFPEPPSEEVSDSLLRIQAAQRRIYVAAGKLPSDAGPALRLIKSP